ncbi:hypothetical protein AAIH51_36750, partial [Pseudomonas aeruginosa]
MTGYARLPGLLRSHRQILLVIVNVLSVSAGSLRVLGGWFRGFRLTSGCRTLAILPQWTEHAVEIGDDERCQSEKLDQRFESVAERSADL